MKIICWGMLIWVILGFMGSADAQDVPPPYENDFTVTYYVDNFPYALNNMLLSYNACLESFMRLNPHIVIYDIPYGTLIRMPRRENCYDYSVYPHNDYMNAFSSRKKGMPLRLKFYENGVWLDEPYYSDDVVYISGYKTVEDIAKAYHICLDDLLAENYLLQYYDDYIKLLASLDVFIPDYYPPCYQSPEQPPIKVVLDATGVITLSGNTYPFSLDLFAKIYNICAEEVLNYRLLERLYTNYSSNIEISIPIDAPACYNAQGQRLRYFDDNNQLLESPIYSDLPIYIVPPHQTIQDVATITGTCIFDLMRVNQFIHLPMNYPVELFIPPAKPCPMDIQWLEIYRPTLLSVALSQNICLKTIAELNPHLSNYSRYGVRYRRYSYQYYHYSNSVIFIKNEPCYQKHVIRNDESIYDVEHRLNICYEDFFYDTYQLPDEDKVIYTAFDVLPCYNEQGQRLQYPLDYDYHRVYSNWQEDEMQHFLPVYTSMQVYSAGRSDSLYEISRQFNVCVDDLLRVNPPLRNRVPPPNYPVFIPQVQPCYDEATGRQFIYLDENGELLSQPILSDNLIHYFDMPFFYLSYYYNICLNRISDANADKYDENWNRKYWGIIIPTDRPPCYDENWRFTDYVCYDQPVDFDADYRHISLTFDIDGTHCYDLKNPDAVIWYKGKPYKVQYYKGTIFESRLFTAWCFGLSMQDIYAINADKEFLPILPLYTRAIPMPTRECYLENPSVLDGKITHSVEYGETLISIAQKYDVPYPMISVANQLGVNNVIWVGQKLVIPTAPQAGDLWWLIPLWLFWGWWCVHIGRMVITEIREKRSWK